MTTTERRPRIPTDLAQQIDQARGDIPFERFVRRALEAHVQEPRKVYVLKDFAMDADEPMAVFSTRDAAEDHLRQMYIAGIKESAAEEHVRADLSEKNIASLTDMAVITEYTLLDGYEPEYRVLDDVVAQHM